MKFHMFKYILQNSADFPKIISGSDVNFQMTTLDFIQNGGEGALPKQHHTLN